MLFKTTVLFFFTAASADWAGSRWLTCGMLWEHHDYDNNGGELLDLQVNVVCGSSWFTDKCVAGGTFTGANSWWNDRVSSARADNGCTVYLYKHVGDLAPLLTITSSQVQNFIWSKNDHVSKWMCTCPNQANFLGYYGRRLEQDEETEE